jgi:hypothetical protein
MIPTEFPLRMLRDWAVAAERWWHPLPGRAGLGCYGTGYNGWGVQTHQKYLAAMAVLGASGDARAVERAVAALRFSLASHHTGEAACTDGTRWGRTWISALGIERMMFAVPLLDPHLADADRAALRRVLADEAHWLCTAYARGAERGIVAGLWNHSGRNQPESNLWNGALLWRAAAMMPEHPEAERWRDTARDFLVNAVSVPADADHPRFRGANFFPNCALDHHGYLNVGYMTICVSNAAMLHFDLRALGLPRPEELDRHQGDLWAVLRRMIFADGRLARIGGDSRVRYAYCQDYLLPSLFYAADVLRDAHAPGLADAFLRMMAREQAFSGDGSFYGRRLAAMADGNPYYYTRLESDRACVLAMAVAHAPLTRTPPAPRASFEESVAGGWCEPEHGAALHRSATRFASFSWRAFRLGQGLCLPPEDGHMAEWLQNLCGVARFPCDVPVPRAERALRCGQVASFPGGFLAWGEIIEGAKVTLNEGWAGENMARHLAVFAALPDDRTVVGLELMRAGAARVYACEAQGLHWALPNDFYNGFQRRLVGVGGVTFLTAPAPPGELHLLSRWVSVDDKTAVLGLYGAEGLRVLRADERRAGAHASLYVEEIAWGGWRGTRAVDPGETFLDVGWAVAASVDAPGARAWAQAHAAARVEGGPPELRRVDVQGFDGHSYIVLANFGDAPVSAELPECVDCLTGAEAGRRVEVAPGAGRLFVLKRSG